MFSINCEKEEEENSENVDHCIFHFSFAIGYVGDQVSELSDDACRVDCWCGMGGSGSFGYISDG